MDDPAGLSTPLLLVAQALAFLAPLAALAIWGHIFPHRGLVALALVPTGLTIVLAALPGLAPAILAIDAAIVLLAIIDVARLPGRRSFTVERQVGRVVSLGKPHAVELSVSYLRRRRQFVAVRDDVPQDFVAEPSEHVLWLAGRSRATLGYQMRAARRGAFAMRRVYLRARSPWGLWQRLIKLPCESPLHVYPDLKQLSEYALLARTNRLNLLGVRRSRRVGQDNEFERLRDYTPDDNYKFIDWRSSARRARLTVKDFQANQSQRIIFLVDTGRMMTNEAAGLSLLDHAFNAMLMMSYVALAGGDSVGLVTFADDIQTYVPPRGDRGQMNRLLHASFDRFPILVESRYDLAFRYLAAHCHRRALVVLITNVIDEVNRVQIEDYLTSLVGKHLPLGVMLRDRRIFEFVEAPLMAEGDLYRAAAAAEVLHWRHRMLLDLQTKGVLSLDVFPEELTAPLVNCYLEVKARHLL